jgi:uncharacterized phage protein (TIGR01671 family)
MKEILFRGKTKVGKWVYGNYAFTDNNGEQHFIFQNKAFEYEVIPETVGQYTGLTDKNGTKIFDGDILQTITTDTNEERKALVGFGEFVDINNDDEYLGFYIEFCDIKTTITQLLLEDTKDNFEVIGNIHDNPELLKGGTDNG